MEKMDSLRDLYLAAPAGQIDSQLKLLIEKWNDEPTAIQLLEVVDKAIYWGAATTFAVSSLQTCLNIAMRREGKELADLLPLATWRDEMQAAEGSAGGSS